MIAYLRLNWRRLMAFRLSFILGLMQRLLTSVLFVIFWLVIVRFDLNAQINSWSFPELLFLIAFFELNMGMFMIFSIGFFMLPLLVPSGKLDDMLVLPISPTKALIGENLSPDRFIRPTAAFLFLFVAILLNPQISLGMLVFGVIVAIIGSLLENLFFMTLNLLSFWLGNVGEVVEAMTELDEAKRFPLDQASRPVQWVLTFVVPVIFVASFPASILTSKLSWAEVGWGLVILVVLCAIWMILFKKLWQYGLKNYQSGGSL